MKIHTKLIVTSAFAAALLWGGMAQTNAAISSEEHPLAAFLLSKLAALGVTDQQQDQVQTILRKHQPQLQPMIQQAVTEHRALRDLIRSGMVDEGAIRAQAAKAAAVDAELAVARAHIAAEVRQALTTEQIAKLKEMQAGVDARVDGVLERIAGYFSGK